MPAAVSRTTIAKRSDANRSEVLSAALELFAERGYHGTSVPEVMKRAGIGASSLYRLFPSKEALVNAVFRDAKGRLAQALRDGLQLDAEPRTLFAEIWQRLTTFAEREPTAFRFLELQDHTPYLDAQSRRDELAVLAPIALGCMDFQRRGAFRDDVPADVVIAFVWGAFVGMVKAARLGYLTLDDRRLDAARDAAFRAFSADRADAATPADHRSRRSPSSPTTRHRR